MSRRLRALVLGAAAGGGSPQWNCRCAVCEAVRRGAAAHRTQCSIAVTADDERWALIEASPDLPEQLRREPRLWPRTGRRHSPIAAAVITDADVDHVAGLLTLRERHPFALYGTRTLHAHLGSNPIFGALDTSLVERRPLRLDERIELRDAQDEPMGVWLQAFGVPGKVPLWAEPEDEASVVTDAVTEDVVGLAIGVAGVESPTLCFVPSCAAVTPELLRHLGEADVLLFDGTLWTDDELRRSELGTKTGRRMGHLPIAGAAGSLEALSGLTARRIFIHVNNSNPILLPGSDARRAVEEAGWEVAHDGMVIDGPVEAVR